MMSDTKKPADLKIHPRLGGVLYRYAKAHNKAASDVENLTAQRKDLEDQLNEVDRDSQEWNELSGDVEGVRRDLRAARRSLEALAVRAFALITKAAEVLPSDDDKEADRVIDEVENPPEKGEDEGSDEDPYQQTLPTVDLASTIEAFTGETAIAERFRAEGMTNMQQVKDYLDELQGPNLDRINTMVEWLGITQGAGERIGAAVGYKPVHPRKQEPKPAKAAKAKAAPERFVVETKPKPRRSGKPSGKKKPAAKKPAKKGAASRK